MQQLNSECTFFVDDTSQDISSTNRSCCVPVTLPTACAIAVLTVLDQSRLKISTHTTSNFNGIISIIVGAIAMPTSSSCLSLEQHFRQPDIFIY
jgi:hypothetical protein